MIIDQAEHVGRPSLRIDVVHLGGDDRTVHKGRPLATAIGAGKQPHLSAEPNLPVILPTSGRRSRSIIAGTRSMGVVSGGSARARPQPVSLSATCVLFEPS